MSKFWFLRRNLVIEIEIWGFNVKILVKRSKLEF